MELLSKCPICNGEKHSNFLVCNDYLVSKEDFQLMKCDNCSFVFTNPRPDSKEIAPYYESEEYYSHSDTKKSLIEYVYSFIRRINVRNKSDLLLKYISKTGKILDYGCGVGLFVKKMHELGVHSIGLEPNEKARSIGKGYGLKIEPLDYLSSIEDSTLDAVSMWHVLEHIHSLDDALKLITKKIKDDGVFIVAVPNSDSWDAKYYEEKWAAYDVPRHLYHFSNQAIKLLFEKFGMYIADYKPLKFDAYYISLLSSKKGLSKYFLAIKNGFISNLKGKKSNVYSSTIYILKHIPK